MKTKQQVELWYTVRQWAMDNNKPYLYGMCDERLQQYDTYEFRYGKEGR